MIEDLINVKAIEEFRMAPKLIAMLQSDKEERLAISLQQYPRLLIDALLTTEDRRFLNMMVLARSVFCVRSSPISAGHTVQGGSTNSAIG